MERKFTNCKNFGKPSCDIRVKENSLFEKPGKPVDYFYEKGVEKTGIEKLNEICSKCDNFEPNKE